MKLLCDLLSRIALYAGMGVLVGQAISAYHGKPNIGLSGFAIVGIIVMLGLIGQIYINKN